MCDGSSWSRHVFTRAVRFLSEITNGTGAIRSDIPYQVYGYQVPNESLEIRLEFLIS